MHRRILLKEKCISAPTNQSAGCPHPPLPLGGGVHVDSWFSQRVATRFVACVFVAVARGGADVCAIYLELHRPASLQLQGNVVHRKHDLQLSSRFVAIASNRARCARGPRLQLRCRTTFALFMLPGMWHALTLRPRFCWKSLYYLLLELVACDFSLSSVKYHARERLPVAPSDRYARCPTAFENDW